MFFILLVFHVIFCTFSVSYIFGALNSFKVGLVSIILYRDVLICVFSRCKGLEFSFHSIGSQLFLNKIFLSLFFLFSSHSLVLEKNSNIF